MSILDVVQAVSKQLANAFWGVDSFNPSTIAVPGENGASMYEYIVKRERRRPAYYGRYLTHTSKPATLTGGEAKFLHGLDCKILPFHARIGGGSVSLSGASGVASGQAHAKTALEAARGLHIPNNVYIYANIEPEWQPTLDWMLGWWEIYAKSEYAGSGGFYCGASAFKTYAAAVEEAKNRFDWGISTMHPVLWVTQSSGGADPSAYGAPKPPGTPFVVRGWQYGFQHGKPNFQYDSNTTTPLGLEHMW
jgi:hypothetical protein